MAYLKIDFGDADTVTYIILLVVIVGYFVLRIVEWYDERKNNNKK